MQTEPHKGIMKIQKASEQSVGAGYGFTDEPQLSAESRPRRFGKSTFVTDAFRAESSAGNSVKFEHPDYVCFSRKAWEEQQKAAKQAIATALEEQRKSMVRKVDMLTRYMRSKRTVYYHDVETLDDMLLEKDVLAILNGKDTNE